MSATRSLPRGSVPVGRDFIERFGRRRFGPRHCFICSRRIPESDRTVEHVVPRWIQKRHKLASQTVSLLNASSLKYAKLLTPCCKSCNSVYLKRLEDEISRATASGSDAVRELDPLTLYLWCAKIFFGLVYRELTLSKHRDRKGSRATITTREHIRHLSLLHLFLQAVRVPARFRSVQPEIAFPLGSVFVFETQEASDVRLNFDLHTAIPVLGILVRFGRVGIVATLGDGGVIAALAEGEYHRLARVRLHPKQVREFAAKVFYAASLMKEKVVYGLDVIDGVLDVVQMPIVGGRSEILIDPIRPLTPADVFHPTSPEHYAQTVAAMRFEPLESVFRPPDQVATIIPLSRPIPFMDINDPRTHASGGGVHREKRYGKLFKLI